MDFRDFNNASLNEDFSLPLIELLMDATMGFRVMSFMKGFLGNNQVKMDQEDEDLTIVSTP